MQPARRRSDRSPLYAYTAMALAFGTVYVFSLPVGLATGEWVVLLAPALVYGVYCAVGRGPVALSHLVWRHAETGARISRVTAAPQPDRFTVVRRMLVVGIALPIGVGVAATVILALAMRLPEIAPWASRRLWYHFFLGYVVISAAAAGVAGTGLGLFVPVAMRWVRRSR